MCLFIANRLEHAAPAWAEITPETTNHRAAVKTIIAPDGAQVMDINEISLAAVKEEKGSHRETETISNHVIEIANLPTTEKAPETIETVASLPQ